MTTVQSFRLPDLGEGLTDADLVTWHVSVGDTVELNQVLAEVETAKASVELPSPFAGTVTALLVDAGSTVDVGTPIIDIRTDADDTERVPVLVGYGVSPDAPSRRSSRNAASPQPPAAATAEPTGRPLASPPVRALAAEQGVDLDDVRATGRRGEVTRDDLAAHRASRAPGMREYGMREHGGREDGGREDGGRTRIPVTGVRKATAEAMARSAFTAPHVTEFLTVDATATVELVEKLRASIQFETIKLTPLAIVAKALLTALRDHPDLNSTWDEQTGEIVVDSAVQLGIAADTPRGLTVPHITNAHELGLRDLARELDSLTVTAKEGRTAPADLVGSTITITNIGVFGVDAGTPILNPGEAAILCVGTIARRPWEYRGEVALRSTVTLSLSFDHRIVDGRQGSRFLADIGAMIADPVTMLAR